MADPINPNRVRDRRTFVPSFNTLQDAFKSAGIEAPDAETGVSNAVALATSVNPPPLLGEYEQVNGELRAMAESVVQLAKIQDEVFNSVYAPGYAAAKATPDVRGKLAAYLATVPGLKDVEGLETYLYLSLARVLAAYAGFGRGSSTTSVKADRVPTVGVYMSYFEDMENGVALPVEVTRQFEVVIPGLVAAVAQEFRQTGGVENPQVFIDHLTSRFPMIEDNATVYASRVVGEGNYLKFFDPERAHRFLKDDNLRGEIQRRVLEGNGAIPERTEMFLLARALDASVRRFGAGPVAFSERFKSCPELEDPAKLNEGLSESHKKTLPEGGFFLNPTLFFRDSLKLDNNGNISPVALFYGLDKETMGLLRKLVIGEAALVNFNQAEFTRLFESSLANGISFMVPPMGEKESLFSYLRKSVVEPEQGGRPDATGYALTLARTFGRPFEIGPSAAMTVLKGLKADDPSTPTRLLEHSRQIAGSKFAQEGIYEQILTSSARRLMLQRFGMNPFLDYLTGDTVPLVRVPEPNRIQGVDAVQDAFHKTEVALVNAVEALKSNPESPEYQTRLQVLMGYYILGETAFDSMRLPYARLDKCPAKRLPGLLPALEMKEGEYRLFYAGGRLPYSSRIVATADPNLPAGTVGVPSETMATLRGHLLADYLRKSPDANGNDLDKVVKAHFLAVIFSAYNVNCPGANLLSELQRRFSAFKTRLGEEGPEYLESFKRVSLQFGRQFPADQAGDFRYICGEDTTKALGYSSRAFLSRLSWQALSDPMVSDHLKELNQEWRVVLSRYPRIHAQSFIGVRMVVNPPEDNTLRSHPELARSLNLDYDGDCVELIGMSWLNPLMNKLLERHAFDVAIFDAGRMSGLSFGLDLNALEGIIKGNMHFNPVGFDRTGAILDEDMKAVLEQIVPDRSEILATCMTDSNAFVHFYLSTLRALKDHLGVNEDPTKLGALVVLNGDTGESTNVTRAFFHHLVEKIVGEPSARAALDSYFIAPGKKAKTNPQELQARLLENLAEVGDMLPAVFAGFYNLGADFAVRQTGSSSTKGLSLSDQLVYTRNDKAVTAIRETFRARAASLHLAASRGFMTKDAEMTALLRLEHGGVEASGKSWQKEFAVLHKAYIESTPENRDAMYQAVEQFLVGCLDRPDVGLKPLLRASVQLSADRYEFEFGVPHLWTEQLLSGSIKAKEELLAISSMGVVNQIDGNVMPTTFDDLLGGLTVEGLATSSIPAADRSVKSKQQVPVAGEIGKDLQAAMADVTVGAVEANPVGVFYALDDFLQQDSNTVLLSEWVKGRKVQLRSEVMPTEQLAGFQKELATLLFAVPYRGAAVGELLKQVYAVDPKATTEVLSVLKDAGFPRVSPDSVGVHPMEGLRVQDGKAQRTPLAEMPHRGLPIGSIMAGAICEDGTQAALGSRHTSGSTQEVYASLADFWKMKYGPFPQRSPYFRQGAQRLLSANPLAFEGLASFTAAFSSQVKGTPDSDYQTAKTRQVVGGVEVFPGEAYRVKDGVLVVGTNRPEKVSFALKAGIEASASVEKVQPSKIVLTVTAEGFEKLTGKAPSKVSSFHDGVFAGAPISGFQQGNAFKVIIPSESYEGVVAAAGRPLLVEPAEKAVLRPVTPQTKGYTCFCVKDPVAFAKENGSFAPRGAMLNIEQGFAVASTKALTQSTTQGFMVFVDFVKERPLTKYRAALAPANGVVTKVMPEGSRGGFDVFEVGYKADDGKDHKVSLQLPKGHFPSVQEGQRLDAGDPLSFGHVSLTDKAPLRENFRLELAQYVYAYYYKGKDSMWSSNVETMARCLVAPNGGRDKFVSIGQAYQAVDDKRLLEPREAATRLGKMDHLLAASLLGSGIISERTELEALSPENPAMLRGHTALDKTLHPTHETRKSLSFLPEDLMSNNKRAVIERMAAAGIGGM